MSSATVLVDSGPGAGAFKPLRPQVVSRPTDVSASVEASARIIWILTRTSHFAEFITYWASRPKPRRLLSLRALDNARVEVLRALFERVVVKQEDVCLLGSDELAEVMAAENAADLFIGGRVDHDDEVIVLYRGNLDSIVVPFAAFRSRPDGPRPDFDELGIIDFGQTIRLGRYEASADAVLYEVDREYRRRAKKARLQQDPSLGACLRRLRLQKGLTLADFSPDVTEKEVGRIERGEVERPRLETLEKIARRLGVAVGEIESY